MSQVTGNKEMYRRTLEIFHEKLVSVCNDLIAFLDAKDLKNFAVSVHSMKTMLVIMPGLCQRQRLIWKGLRKTMKLIFCTHLFVEFKEKLLSLHEKLSAIFKNSEELSAEEERPLNTDNLQKNAQKAHTLFTGKVLLVDVRRWLFTSTKKNC